MNVTHKITMDLTRPTNGNRINVVEGDKNSRIVNVHLYENSVSWRVPTDASILIKWERESGVGGEYSQLSDGSSAWSAAGNVLTITLSEESTEYSGNVKFSIVLTSGDSQISTFLIIANVHAVANGKEEANSGTSSADIAGLQKQIGNLSKLETENKSNLVEAINEVASSDSSQNPAGGGLSTTAANLLVEILRNGVYGTDQSSNITALAAELAVTEPEQPEEPDAPVEPDEPEKTLTSISVTYSGGDVAVGTAMADLTGIVVTAHYSDGSTATVTGYTLSGEIAEGSNTVTVSYGGKTTTFTVTGVAESGGDETEAKYPLTNGSWTASDGRTVTITNGNHIALSGSGAMSFNALKLYDGFNINTEEDCINQNAMFTIPAGSNCVFGFKNKTHAYTPQTLWLYPATGSEYTSVVTEKSLDTNDVEKTFTPDVDFAVGAIRLWSNAHNASGFDVFLTVDGEVWI